MTLSPAYLVDKAIHDVQHGATHLRMDRDTIRVAVIHELIDGGWLPRGTPSIVDGQAAPDEIPWAYANATSVQPAEAIAADPPPHLYVSPEAIALARGLNAATHDALTDYHVGLLAYWFARAEQDRQRAETAGETWGNTVRYSTPDRRNADGSRTSTVQRMCNGCGMKLGDATQDELLAAVVGDIPDVTSECPNCSKDQPHD